MFKRFKTSLFQPANIASYRKDSAFTTILYYLLLVILAIIPSVILIFSYDGFSHSTKSYIRKEFIGVEIPYEIENYQLVKTSDDDKEYHEYILSNNSIIVFTEQEANEIKYNNLYVGTVVIFAKDRVIYDELLMKKVEFTYKDDLHLLSLNFSLAKENDIHFWDTVFSIANKVAKDISFKNRLFTTFYVFIELSLMLLIFSLIITLFQIRKIREHINFGKSWQLAIYAMTPYIILTLFGDLVNLELLSIIGVVVSYAYASKTSLSIIYNN